METSRLQGILRGTPSGEVVLEKVMSDEQVQPGERVLTSGGDLVFPKGMPVGTVADVAKGAESFLNIRIKPAADLSKLEEVLVITGKEEKTPSVTENGPARAVDILAQRLPSVPDKAPDDPSKPPPPTSGLTIAPAPAKPGAPGVSTPKLQQGNALAGQAGKAVAPASITGASARAPVASAPKPHGNAPAPGSSKPVAGAPTTTKPLAGAPAVTPATAQKPVPAAVKVSDVVTTPGSSTAKPAATSTKPATAPSKPPAASPSTPPPAPEDKPQ